MTLYLNGTTGVSGVDGSAGTPSLQGNDTNTGIIFGTDTVGVSTGGVQRTTVDSSGRLLVGVGSANANGGVLQLFGGITFPGTQVAATDVNTLDDYEEGDWTPEIAFGGGVVGQSYTIQVGKYTKIGRLVTIQCRLAFSNKGTSTGPANLRALPFTPIGTYGANSGVGLAYVNSGGVNFGAASRYAVDLGSTIIVLRYANGGNSTDMTNNDFTNSTDVIVAGQYIA